MDEFDNIVKKASDAFYSVVRKSGEFVENTKISYNINLEKDKITKLQSMIGAKLYKLYKDGEPLQTVFANDPEIFIKDFEAIDAHEENIRNLERGYAETKSYIICPECSSKLPLNSVYCPKCGTKLTASSVDPTDE